MIDFEYLWERRKVVKRVADNWGKLFLHKPFESKGRKGEPAVLFVRINARGRVFNQGWTLRKYHNIRTILITRVFEYQFQREAFDEIYIYFSYKHLVRLVAKLGEKYNLIAVIGMTQPARQTLELINMHRNWPVIADPYDSYWAYCYFNNICPGSIDDPNIQWTDAEIAAEKECFAKADGIICRMGYIQPLLEEVGLKTPTLLLEDCCNSLFFQEITETSCPKRDEWSVVYIGIFYPMNWDSKFVGGNQMASLGKLFAEEKIHFHLYPSPHHTYQYPEYKAEARRNPYFHIHESVPFRKIHKVISQYDFGWMALDVSNNIFYSNPIIYNNLLPQKIFTFLEAGLPIITNGICEKYERLIKEFGVGISLDGNAPKGLHAAIESMDIKQMRRNIMRVRENLLLKNRSPELMNFLLELKSKFVTHKI